MNSKKYAYTWEDLEEKGKTSKSLAQMIIDDPELSDLDEIIVGQFTCGYDSSAQDIINTFVEEKDKLQHIRSLFIGDMDGEECEVSWIEQGDYTELLKALPNLRKLTIKGAEGLKLGEQGHAKLEYLEIICGGLSSSVLKELGKGNYSSLQKLILYLGVEDYGFDGTAEDIRELVTADNFPALTYLGIVDSEIQDEVTEVIMGSSVLKQLDVLELSMGTLTDKGGQSILDNKDKIEHLKLIDCHYHFMSDGMMKQLSELPVEINLDEQEEAEEYRGEIYYYPYLTE